MSQRQTIWITFWIPIWIDYPFIHELSGKNLCLHYFPLDKQTHQIDLTNDHEIWVRICVKNNSTGSIYASHVSVCLTTWGWHGERIKCQWSSSKIPWARSFIAYPLAQWLFTLHNSHMSINNISVSSTQCALGVICLIEIVACMLELRLNVPTWTLVSSATIVNLELRSSLVRVFYDGIFVFYCSFDASKMHRARCQNECVVWTDTLFKCAQIIIISFFGEMGESAADCRQMIVLSEAVLFFERQIVSSGLLLWLSFVGWNSKKKLNHFWEKTHFVSLCNRFHAKFILI